MIKPRKPPYANTKVDPYRSKAEIEKLLESYGVEQTQWNMDLKQGVVQLRFLVEAEIKGVKRQVGIEVNPPTFLATRRTWDAVTGRYMKVQAPNWAQTFRLLHWWLKAKLEAVAYGLSSVEREFLAEVVVKLPGQVQPVTVGHLLDQGNLLPALTGPPEDKEES